VKVSVYICSASYITLNHLIISRHFYLKRFTNEENNRSNQTNKRATTAHTHSTVGLNITLRYQMCAIKRNEIKSNTEELTLSESFNRLREFLLMKREERKSVAEEKQELPEAVHRSHTHTHTHTQHLRAAFEAGIKHTHTHTHCSRSQTMAMTADRRISV